MEENAPQSCDVLIIGAGAAGMMCAMEAGKRGRSVVILEQAKAAGRKIRISGGGRCNFTNINTGPEQFVSDNPRFCISALSRYQPSDFIRWVEAEGIAYHEKTLGQLFCDDSAAQIVGMLTQGCAQAGVRIHTHNKVHTVQRLEGGFLVHTETGQWQAEALVVACGGPSIPKMGSSRLGYQIASQFGLRLIEPVAALVPLTFDGAQGKALAALSGLSCPVVVRCRNAEFREAMLFTHRGLSGPAILQISSYWRPGDALEIDPLPDDDIQAHIERLRTQQPKMTINKALAQKLPSRLAQSLCDELGLHHRMAEFSNEHCKRLVERVHRWRCTPNGTEGMRTAEVTRGGVDTRALSPTTFEAKKVPQLYFIGEVVDVTGHLGGFNFQWAWASGHACGQVV